MSTISTSVAELSRTTQTTSKNATSSSNSLGSDAFYQLLAAQMKYQDPSQQTDSSQMILQLSLLSMVESVNSLSSLFAQSMDDSTLQNGANLVGKEATIGVDSVNTIKGTIESVGFTSSGMMVQVDGKYYESWRIVEIGTPQASRENSTISQEISSQMMKAEMLG